MRAGARAMATSPEANQAKETELDLDAVDAVDGTATVPVPSLIYGGARAWGPAGDADAELKNAYDSVNLVRSDLIREFENRGVRVAQLERENITKKNALVEAETRMTLAESEKNKWFDAVTELKRQRDARAAEAREERAEAERDAETRVRRAAALEGELATANARLARADEETKRLKARNDALERETGFRASSENQHRDAEKSEDAAAQRLARRLAESARDAAESRAFELESTRDSAAALVDLETADTEASATFAREEIRRLRRELEAARAASGTRAPRATLDVSLDAEEARGDGDDGFGPGAVASLRDRLAVRERVAEQLKLALEEAEAAREEEREAAAARLEAAEEARVAAAETARREAEEKAGAEMAREKARAAALEARVATLRALVDAEDAETAETAARARGDGGDGENHTVYGGDTAEGRDAPLAAARARNKRLAGEAASARRDAAEATARAQNAERRASAAESAAASRDLAVAELERHLVATTGERTPETSPSADGEISAAASASLLPMVAAQRDRHKRRASELEIRVAELEASLATATEERERSRADAAALYDKVIHVQDYYHASSKTGLLAGAGAGPGGTRIVRVDDAGVALDKEDGPLAALAARRAARYGCFPGGGLRSSSIPGGDPVPLDQLPGGDPGGVLARFATMKSATSVSSGLWHTFPGLPGLGLGGKTRAAKLTRLFFVAYLGVIHVLLFRVATAGTPG